jgi:protein-L-isoaspartate(D-aspartate) O-methyltransferase
MSSGWIEWQLVRRGIRDERVLAAMARVPRELFVPPAERAHAYADAALALARGQTISQPYMVACICQALAVQTGERVLDVGTGSGYQAAVLAELAGRVVSIERIAELTEQARLNLQAADYADRVELVVGDGREGVPEQAPFDAIAVAAAAEEPPPALLEQLAPGGRMVIPLGGGREQYLVLVSGGRLRALVPVRFVPLV